MQNEYMELATSISNVLAPITNYKKDVISDNGYQKIIKYVFKNSNDNIYFYPTKNNVNFAIIERCLYYYNDSYQDYSDTLNDLYYRLEDNREKRIINVTSPNQEVTIYVGYSYYEAEDIFIYTIDNDKFLKAIETLEKNKLNITSFKETKIEGNITLDDNMVVYTSIPYDEGWHVKVDNKEVKTQKLAKALLTFEAPSGKHNITIYYRIKGLGLGLLVSFVSLVLALGDILFHKKIIKFFNK